MTAFSFWIKGITGFGGPLLAVPMLAPFLGVEHTVVVVSLGNIVSNAMLLWSNRHAATTHRRLLTRLLLAGAVGTIVGTVLLTRLDDAVLSLVLAASVFLYVVVSLARPEATLTPRQGLMLAVPAGAVGGLMHGALGNSGVVFGSFYHSLKWPRDEFVFALTVTFLGFGLLQTGTLLQLGSFAGERLGQALLATIPVVVVTPLGEAVARGLNPAVFSRAVLALLAFAGVVLVAGVLL